MEITEEIEYKGFDLRITFDYYKGFAGSQTEPPEPEMIEIEMVELIVEHHPRKGEMAYPVDITDLLTETQLKEIEEKLWSKNRRIN